MTSAAVLWVALMAAVVGLAAAWFVVPHPPELDGEAWFKGILVARLADRAPADVMRWVVWHPLGRWPERKLAHPTVESMPGKLLPGEGELLARLARLPNIVARWAMLRDEAVAKTLTLPGDLPPEASPARWLGAASGWDRVRDDALPASAERRTSSSWLLIDDPRPGVPDVSAAFAGFAEVRTLASLCADPVIGGAWEMARTRLAQVGQVTAAEWDTIAAGMAPWGRVAMASAVDSLAKVMETKLPVNKPERRLIVAATGGAMPVLLRALAERVDLRDRVIAVVSVGGAVGGLPDQQGPLSEAVADDWMAHNFQHGLMDVEILRRIPYASIQWLDTSEPVPGAGGIPVARARFPEPEWDGRAFRCVEPVDLGVVPVEADLPVDEVVGALRLVVDLWVLSRR